MSGTSPSLLSGRLPAVDQFSTVFKRHDLLFGARGVRADSTHDHHRVTGASLRPPGHWRRPCGRPRTSWLREIDTDVQSVNIGVHSAWKRPVIARCDDISSTRQYSVMAHTSGATEDKGCYMLYQAARFVIGQRVGRDVRSSQYLRL